jgi:hypothetical protein
MALLLLKLVALLVVEPDIVVDAKIRKSGFQIASQGTR